MQAMNVPSSIKGGRGEKPDRPIWILDSTLREGEQSPGVYFPAAKRLEIARMLDAVGVDIIETGNPAADIDIAAAVRAAAKAGMRARIGAHARCVLDDVKLALDCGIGFLGLFLSVSGRRLRLDYRIELGEAIERVQSIIAYAKAFDPNLVIRYTPEDAVRSSFDDVVAVTAAAVETGADIISVADTTGAMSPLLDSRSLPRYVRRLRRALAARKLFPRIEVHCHNDRGLALANALHACAAGADVVDAAVLGLGERAGIVDLAELLVNLRELFPDRAGSWRLARIMPLYEFVSESSHRPIPDHRPIVGKHAFTHYSGVHVRAVSEDPVIYQSLDPNLVGRDWALSLGPQSGRGSVELALKLIDREDLAKDKELVSEVLAEIKTLTKGGAAMEVHREFVSLVWRHEKARRLAQAEGPSAEESLASGAAEKSLKAL